MELTKICTTCKLDKNLSAFSKDNSTKDGVSYPCKDCSKFKSKQWYLKNSEKKLSYMKLQRKNNQDHFKKLQQARQKKNPWKFTLKSIKKRCNNPNDSAYKYYGGKGIKCLITESELKFLWYRDKAYLMDKPSVDRRDNDGNYILDNCSYMEIIDNIKKEHINRKRKVRK